MEKIERPKKVSKLDKQILSKKNFEENTDNQLDKIYDKLDELVDKLNIAEKEIIFSEVLWKNENPTSEFKAQTINLKENSYKYFIIFSRISTSNSTIHSQIIRAKDNFHLTKHGTYTPAGTAYIDFTYRNYCSSTQKSIYFSNALNFNTSSTTITTNNKELIPIQIVGFN